MSKRPSQSSPSVGPSDGPRKRVQLSVPTIASVAPGISRWTSADIPLDLPPLPPISPQLEEQVFRHPGLGGPNYERLEWYGDAVLEMLSTELVFETFPHLPAGRCSQIREQLVRNITLAEFYRHYGMQHKTQLPTDMGSMVDLIHRSGRDKDVIKIQGDVFEAYVGAVVKSDPQHGRVNVVTWLKALWARTLNDQIKEAERLHETCLKAQGQLSTQQPTTHGQSATQQHTTAQVNTEPITKSKGQRTQKELLSQAIVVRGIKIRYEDMPCKKKDKDTKLPLFSIGAYMDGWGEVNKLLGIGTALGKKEAGQKAARAALENRKLMKVYEAKKEVWVKEARADNPIP
ncbi:ribonuclease III [Fusarium austroafricanum]|uniref:Ribonuclease III n=1 Tax=Fusarium austroafricanum TaxID=2364996 RepID=A0A8H4K388_9HYPO|nr:ribonuclease III [Fusarium austroafricanum]